MERRSTILKVLSPVENKNGKTFWMRIGSAFINRDGSTNVYLNAYPTSGKLHIRELDDRDRNGGDQRNERKYQGDDPAPNLSDGRPFLDTTPDDLPF